MMVELQLISSCTIFFFLPSDLTLENHPNLQSSTNPCNQDEILIGLSCQVIVPILFKIFFFPNYICLSLNFTHEPNSNPCIPNPYDPRSPHWLCISYNCIVNLYMSKFIKGSKLAPRQQQQWQRVRPKILYGSLPLYFWIFLAIVGLEFWVFIGFAGAFVVWVC